MIYDYKTGFREKKKSTIKPFSTTKYFRVSNQFTTNKLYLRTCINNCKIPFLFFLIQILPARMYIFTNKQQ